MCPNCKTLKRLLQKQDLAFRVVDVSQNREMLDRLVHDVLRSVPQVYRKVSEELYYVGDFDYVSQNLESL